MVTVDKRLRQSVESQGGPLNVRCVYRELGSPEGTLPRTGDVQETARAVLKVGAERKRGEALGLTPAVTACTALLVGRRAGWFAAF